MAEDREGNMWFGSEKCIIKYDGKKFAFYDIPFGTKDSEVSSIVLDKKGDLLFGTSKSGIIRYDGKAFTNFFSKG
jgi:ligand-binding sensor domain-containing protein